MTRCSFTWKDEEEATLANLSMDVRRGQLVAVVGIVGSGKSSLLSALLGDMKKLSGKASVSVSYFHNCDFFSSYNLCSKNYLAHN